MMYSLPFTSVLRMAWFTTVCVYSGVSMQNSLVSCLYLLGLWADHVVISQLLICLHLL